MSATATATATKPKKKPAAKKQPKEPRAKKSTNQTPQRERKILGLIDDAIKQRGVIYQAEREFEAARADQNEAKKHLEAMQTRLNAIISEIESVRDGKPLQGTLPLDTAATNGHAVDPALIVLKLSDSLIEKLGEADIVKVSQLEAAISRGDFVPNRIKGIGESAVDKVTDALMKYRAENPIEAPKEAPAENGEQPKEESKAAKAE